MKDKTYIITGASRGVGLAVSKALAAAGAATVLVSSDNDALAFAQDEIGRIYENAGLQDRSYAYPLDLRKPENIADFFKDIKERGLIIDGLIYCAGAAPLRPAVQMMPSVMSDTFAVNFFSFAEMARLYLKNRKKNLSGGGLWLFPASPLLIMKAAGLLTRLQKPLLNAA